MAKKVYNMPAIVWLKVTDYIHGWITHELGSNVFVKGQRVVCVQHLPGAREILRMETIEDLMDKQRVGSSMSNTRMNCFTAGLIIDPEVMEREYGVTRKLMELFVPVECPKMCLTRHGVLRPWTSDVCFGKEQTTSMQRLLRNEFWNAVDEFSVIYAEELEGDKFPAIEMIEEFCKRTKTPDIYADTIRREWQRRQKRKRPVC